MTMQPDIRPHVAQQPREHRLSIGGVGTPDLDFIDVADLTECIQVRSCHAARPDHSHHSAIMPRQILDAEPCTTPNSHVLKKAVVDHRNRCRILGTEQEQNAEECSWRAGVLVLPNAAVLARPSHHVGEHTSADEAIFLAAASHHGPPVIRGRLFARWHVEIDAAHAHGFAANHFPEGCVQRRHAQWHVKDFLSVGIVD